MGRETDGVQHTLIVGTGTSGISGTGSASGTDGVIGLGAGTKTEIWSSTSRSRGRSSGCAAVGTGSTGIDSGITGTSSGSTGSGSGSSGTSRDALGRDSTTTTSG